MRIDPPVAGGSLRKVPFKERRPLTDRFWAKVVVVPYDRGCWIWVGATAGVPRREYGCLGFLNRVEKAHRISWILHTGPIPEGMDVLHRCDVRTCVRPDHLFLGTDKENVEDRQSKQRHAFGERNGKSKLTTSLALEIMALYEPRKFGQRKIARRLGLKESTEADSVVTGR
jgi:hypothetical protein